MVTQERRLNAEFIELRTAKASVEDTLARTQDELNRAHSLIKSLEAANTQLKVMEQAALMGQTTIRNDLKNLQQSVQASTRVSKSFGKNADADSGAGPSADAATTIRLTEAKFEAKIRQLVNKLEFLKNQLER